ncbi:DUF6479 family protein [Streptomyces sp. NPDC005551]|uniref:DUF6479 family protein n=1 Tax=unclassified Streptomyces TaxID=2593676 RepID=UPI0033C22E79
MNLLVNDMAASANRGLVAGFAPLVIGLAVVALLGGAMWMGSRVRREEPPRPRADEQPRPPVSGPVFEVYENREPDEVPRSSQRLTPYQLAAHGNIASKPSGNTTRRRWSAGSSGSFGSGGSGSH